MRRSPLLVPALLLLLLLAALPVQAGVDVRTVTLDNGLRLYVLEREASPTFAAIYLFGVGGTSDPKGRSGIAHLLEHMMFKGTGTIGTLDAAKEAPLMGRLAGLWDELHAELDKRSDPFREADEERIGALEAEIERLSAEQKKLIVKNEYDELITRAGGVGLNASTNRDATRYVIQLPSNRLEFWFKMESQRLLDPVFREFYSERDVVLEERRLRTENTAGGRAYEAMQSLLFTAHPYGVPVVGWPRDLQRLVRGDAEDYFRTYYSPSNCIMVLAGDVEFEEVRRLALKYFGPWKRQQLPRLPVTAEPEQSGERRTVIEFDAEPQISMAWRTVAEGHPDAYALDVLSMILGGLSSSRFDEILVEKEKLAASAGTSHPTMKHSGYFNAYGIPREGHDVGDLETAFEREIRRIQQDGVTAEELERARIAVETSRVRGLKSNMGQASRVANAVFFAGSPDYLDEYEGRINEVTVERVKQAAIDYLKSARKNVVEVRKIEGAGGGGTGRGAGVAHQRGGNPGQRGQAHSAGFKQAKAMIDAARPVDLRIPEIGKDLQRVELQSGITVFIKEDHSAPSVEMAFTWLGGSNTTPVEQLAPFTLASSLLSQGGTRELTPTELQLRLDELGMDFNLWIGSTQSGARFWSLKRNFAEAFDLALEVLMHPRLDPARLETLRGQFIQRMKRRGDSPRGGVSALVRQVIYKGQPRLGYVPTREEIEAVTPEQIRAIWKRYIGRDNLYVTVVGDFESSRMLDLLEERLGAWRKAEDAERKFLSYEPLIRPGLYVVEKDLPQPAVRISHQMKLDRTAPLEDHAAVEILNDILGGSGFRSRLMERLRSDEGLTYGISSRIFHQGRPGTPGSASISYQTKKDSVARSIDSVLDEFGKIIREKVGRAEIQEQIEAWRNRFIFGYTNDFYTVWRLMANELDDRPYDYDRMELDAVQRVTVARVHRVARKYLSPGNLTIAVYGKLSEADRAALAERFELRTLSQEEIFTGGY